ncbi:MAG: vitamin K epoxide reductase family protein, partial [Thermomicrobiaceae bacterium]|nr:vitamin K epoxide reductase family protein [Thermomicrobiaceae bacterium]
MRQQFLQERWSQFVVVALGGWLAAAPATFGYGGALAWSDAVTGALVTILGLLSIRYERGWARWANTGLGIWLLFAPLVFWAATPAAYINDTLVGALVIGLALLVPGMPGMLMLPGPEVPPGWTYNPSTWLQRAPPIALALISFLIARYLAAFQLGYIGHAWDPFFGESTVRVLTSDVSRAWPISDAGLGAVSYLLEALSGFMGHRDRWRTMPWMVLMFGFLVVPLGIVSIVLVILQPVAVGHWCTLCLLTALFMLVMIPFAVDEVVAMGQFLVTAHRQRQPFWTTFWRGGTPDPHATTREPAPATFDSPLPEQAVAMARGITLPWSLLVSAGLGLWLMAAPGVLGYGGAVADSDHLVGPLVVVVAVIAMAEVV